MRRDSGSPLAPINFHFEQGCGLPIRQLYPWRAIDDRVHPHHACLNTRATVKLISDVYLSKLFLFHLMEEAVTHVNDLSADSR